MWHFFIHSDILLSSLLHTDDVAMPRHVQLYAIVSRGGGDA
jgi:hypothetical protein